jgi:hypothetical protein
MVGQYLFSQLPIFVGQINHWLRGWLLELMNIVVHRDEPNLTRLVDFAIWILSLRLLHGLMFDPLLETLFVLALLWCAPFFTQHFGIPGSIVSLPPPPSTTAPPQVTAVYRSWVTLTCTMCTEFFRPPDPGSELALTAHF